MDAFSSNAEEVLQKSVDVSKDNRNLDLHSYLELERCQTFIKDNDYKKVALQFPDELLWCSAQVVSFLEKNTSAKYFILGDTSYGSCCVDEVAAQHAEADCIIHFGRSCLSPTTRLPVLYVFGREPVDMEDLTKAFQDLFHEPEQPVLVLYDVTYAHITDELENRLKSINSCLVVSKIPVRLTNGSSDKSDNHNNVITPEGLLETNHTNIHTVIGRQFSLPVDHKLEDYSIFYISEDSLTLKYIMMTLNKCAFCTYNPEQRTHRRENVNINKMLMKRYHMIERAKDADIVGIIVGTLGVARYLDILNHLKTILKKAGKKYYTFAVGKINVAKLANFMEVQVYVFVACQENSLIDSSEFYQPVVTPFEMEIACNPAREWTGEYVTDFSQLLPGASKHVPMPDSLQYETDVSLITGRIRSIGRSDDPDLENKEGTVAKRDEMLAVVEHNTAGEYLSQRSWQGLQADLGQTEVTGVVEGTRGIAASYDHEDGTPV